MWRSGDERHQAIPRARSKVPPTLLRHSALCCRNDVCQGQDDCGFQRAWATKSGTGSLQRDPLCWGLDVRVLEEKMGVLFFAMRMHCAMVQPRLTRATPSPQAACASCAALYEAQLTLHRWHWLPLARRQRVLLPHCKAAGGSGSSNSTLRSMASVTTSGRPPNTICADMWPSKQESAACARRNSRLSSSSSRAHRRAPAPTTDAVSVASITNNFRAANTWHEKLCKININLLTAEITKKTSNYVTGLKPTKQICHVAEQHEETTTNANVAKNELSCHKAESKRVNNADFNERSATTTLTKKLWKNASRRVQLAAAAAAQTACLDQWRSVLCNDSYKVGLASA